MMIAALACSILAISQASSLLALMPEMDASCVADCIDQTLTDVSVPLVWSLSLLVSICIAVVFILVQDLPAKRALAVERRFRNRHRLHSTQMRD